MSTIIDGKKRIPFLRGMLAHYLIEHGFSFQDAYSVADQVRGALQKEQEVSSKKMVDLVQSQVRKQFEDRPIGDGIFWEPRTQLMVEEERGRQLFSQERLADSLKVPGLSPNQAHQVANRIEFALIRTGKMVVEHQDILKAALRILRKEFGEEYADRYRAWHRFQNDEGARPIVVLIGGASGVGKTSIAVALANILKFSRMSSTDEIRQVMRLMIAPELMPSLHKSSYAAWKSAEAIPENVDPIIYTFHEQASRVCVGVRAIVERAIEENVSLVLDGVHLLPDLIDLKQYSKQAQFTWVNLFLPDEKVFKERFRSRGKEASRRTSHRYLGYLDEILKIQQHILDAGESAGIPAFENMDFDETVQSISLQIMDALRHQANPAYVAAK